ncbi:MAG: Fic family protein [Acholeplasmatales bacterium]|nr:Fic family protein [Acholeplasmatales bacterium]
MNDFELTQSLLRERAELRSKLNLLPYDGTPEVKELSNGKYLYIRKRILDKVTSTYVGPYSDDLYNLLIRNANEAKLLKKSIRNIDKELAKLGYSEEDVKPNVLINLEYARSNMKKIIYDQAVLEGVGTTFPDTEAIIDNGKVNNMTADDVQKILNLKHAWEFILDKDVINAPSNYYLSSYIAKLVNEGFYQDGGRIRGVPVTIGGTSYIPPIPIEVLVKEKIDEIRNSNIAKEDIAIELLLYVMKTQIYNDGNKRTAVIFANHFMISNALGLIIIPYDKVQEFKKLLILYYEDKDLNSIKDFLKGCINKI